MRKTVIDIGTNTMLMLIAEFSQSTQTVNTILDLQQIPRLGRDIHKNGYILPESVKKGIEILKNYKQTSQTHNSENITATATSFIRDASNKTEFISSVKEQSGIDIEILSGDGEAKWTFIGGNYDKLQVTGDKLQVCNIDIGGGSTEITTGNIGDCKNLKELITLPVKKKSINIGAVRVKEKFFNSIPPEPNEIKPAEDFVYAALNEIDFDVKNSSLTGVAGTATTLAAIKLGLNKFVSEKVDKIILDISEIFNIFNKLQKYSLDELIAIGDYMPGRADILIPGILILNSFMKKFGFKKINISTKGLRYGIFLREVVSL